MGKYRINSIDFIRTLAILLVITIHALGFSPAGYSFTIDGFNDWALLLLRRLCYICVPLFLLMSGYLNYKKNTIHDVLKQLPNLVLTYLFWMIVIIVFETKYLGFEFNSKSILNIFNYKLYMI